MLNVVYAATTWDSCVSQGAATIQCLEPLFQSVVVAIVSLVGGALFIMLLIGGFRFLVSGGDQKKLEQAKNTLTSAIIGVVVIVVAYLILRTIQVFTGVEVTKFIVPSSK